MPAIYRVGKSFCVDIPPLVFHHKFVILARVECQMLIKSELSSSNRATCRNAECKNNAVKIKKGELRHGSWVDIPGQDHGAWHWKHW